MNILTLSLWPGSVVGNGFCGPRESAGTEEKKRRREPITFSIPIIAKNWLKKFTLFYGVNMEVYLDLV